MFLISFNILWSFNLFFAIFYLWFLLSFILYVTPVLKYWLTSYKIKKIKKFEYLLGLDLINLNLTPLLISILIFSSWSSPVIVSWFSHIFFSYFHYKLFYFLLIIFSFMLILYHSFFYFSSREIYDFFIVIYHLFLWSIFLFSANSVLTIIFFIEILSTMVFLLIVTSNFSTVYFYNNLNLNLHTYFHKTLPSTHVNSLIFFFWTSLIASLNLFLFLILFYTQFLTFDLNLIEFLYFNFTTLNNFNDLISAMLIWFNLLFCIFLKCGLVPFFFWKPTFFRGISIHGLSFYILFYYFVILLFFVNLLSNSLNSLFHSFILVNILIFILGFLILILILCESYYLKTFFAFSSILNSLFVFLALTAVNSNVIVFFL
jgi:hypothetical protein